MTAGKSTKGRTGVERRGRTRVVIRRRTHRLSPSVVGICFIMIVGAWGMSPFSGLGSARAQPTDGPANFSEPPSAPTNSSALTSNSTLSGPLTNTIQRVYNWAGYDGNSTIYPTQYVPATSLPLLQSGQYQFQSNATIPVANVLALKVSNLSNEVPVYYNSGPTKNNIFTIDVWLAAVAGSQQYSNGLYNYSTTWQEIVVAPTGLPTGLTNAIVVGNDTALNTSKGNQPPPDNGNSQAALTSLVLAGVALGTSWIPVIGIATAGVSLFAAYEAYTGGTGPYQDSLHLSNTNVGDRKSVV